MTSDRTQYIPGKGIYAARRSGHDGLAEAAVPPEMQALKGSFLSWVLTGKSKVTLTATDNGCQR